MEGEQNPGQPVQPQPIPPTPAPAVAQPASSGSSSTLVIILKIFAVLVVIGMILAMIGGVIAYFAFKKVVNTVKENVELSEGGVSIKDPRTGEEVLGLAGGTETMPKFLEYYNIPVYTGARLVQKTETIVGGVPGGFAGFETGASAVEMEQFFKLAASERGWEGEMSIGGGQGMMIEGQQVVPPAPNDTPEAKMLNYRVKGASGETVISISLIPGGYNLMVNIPGS